MYLPRVYSHARVYVPCIYSHSGVYVPCIYSHSGVYVPCIYSHARVYVPCIYSHARWSYRTRFRSLLVCPCLSSAIISHRLLILSEDRLWKKKNKHLLAEPCLPFKFLLLSCQTYFARLNIPASFPSCAAGC